MKTDVVTKLGGQAGGVGDRGEDLLDRHLEVVGEPDVLGAGSVAALAPGAVGKLAGKEMRLAVAIAARGCGRIGVVAEHAASGDRAGEAVVTWLVVAGGHPPSAGLGVPGDGHLEELARLGLVEVAAGVVPRADDVVDLLAERVDLPPVLVDPVAGDEEPLAVPGHPVMALRRGVEEVIVVLEVLDDGAGAGPRERVGHPDLLIGAVDGAVAGGAGAVVDVAARRDRRARRERVRRLGRRVIATGRRKQAARGRQQKGREQDGHSASRASAHRFLRLAVQKRRGKDQGSMLPPWLQARRPLSGGG